jgi:hypothetical protein
MGVSNIVYPISESIAWRGNARFASKFKGELATQCRIFETTHASSHRKNDEPAHADPQARADRWNLDDYDVVEDGVIVGRIFKVPIAPEDRPWMWASGHNGYIRRAAHGYRGDARGGDGGVQEELAAGIICTEILAKPRSAGANGAAAAMTADSCSWVNAIGDIGAQNRRGGGSQPWGVDS